MTPTTHAASGVAAAEPASAPQVATLRDRLVAGALIAGVQVLRVLPDGLVYRAAHTLGALAYYAMPERRALARANLVRVCAWLDTQGRATPRVAAAARDPKRMDHLVRDAFGHWARTYAESAVAPRYDQATLRARIRLDDPEAARRALAPIGPDEHGRIYLGFHLGSVELAALYASRESDLPVVGPMETVANPALADYFLRTRSALGVTLIPVQDSGREMTARLERGEAVAIVADRSVAGVGSRVELFGAPSRLPAGPSVLAATTGATIHVLAVRRTGWNRWAARVEEIGLDPALGRRERARAALEAEARVLERFVADAPEQWWTALFPIWEDTA